MKERILTLPERHLCPMCRDHAESFTRYEKDRERYEAEDRLRSGRASTPEKIKAAWDLYGKGHDWGRAGPVVRVPPVRFLPDRYDCADMENHPERYTTYQFERTVTRNKDFTVTRIHCGGLTVEETIS